MTIIDSGSLFLGHPV